jgi:hypothetical protein
MAVESNVQPTFSGAKPVPTTGLVLAGLAIAGIWACVAVASMLAPDFVSGSQHEHLQLVPWTDWIWGLVATSSVISSALMGVRTRVFATTPWLVLAVGVAAVWIVVALVSVLSPVFVTGTDPTLIPLAALGVPILGAFLTGFVCSLVKELFEPYKS